MLPDTLIYDFPDIVSPPDHSNDNYDVNSNHFDSDDGEAMSDGSNNGHGISDNIADDPSANWLDNMCAE